MSPTGLTDAKPPSSSHGTEKMREQIRAQALASMDMPRADSNSSKTIEKTVILPHNQNLPSIQSSPTTPYKVLQMSPTDGKQNSEEVVKWLDELSPTKNGPNTDRKTVTEARDNFTLTLSKSAQPKSVVKPNSPILNSDKSSILMCNEPNFE